MSPISNASRLADFGTGIGTAGAIIQTDNVNQRIGIGTTNPQAMLQVGTAISMFGSTGIVSATEYRGDGSNLTGLATTEYVVSVATTTGNLNVSAAATITGAVKIDGNSHLTSTSDSTSTSSGPRGSVSKSLISSCFLS